ncbi:MAG: hypothetical protein JKY37_32045 [Nannocystaceae bacterium]|nr:hypothetical protein [Nannocystaceae bacterium]
MLFSLFAVSLKLVVRPHSPRRENPDASSTGGSGRLAWPAAGLGPKRSHHHAHRGLLLVGVFASGCIYGEVEGWTGTESTNSQTGTRTAGGSDSSGSADPCSNDTHEPNDSPNDSFDLGSIRSDAEPAQIEATLSSSDPADWFSYEGQEVAGTVGTAAAATSANLSVCVYLQCIVGTAEVDCGAQTRSMSPRGVPGCCGMGMASAEHTCGDDLSRDVTVTVNVSATNPGNSCVPYELNYAFHLGA